MSNDAYLRSILSTQDLTDQEVATLRATRDAIQSHLAVLSGNPRFYYAGSFAKRTMIRANYDLDIVIYWPSDCGVTVKAIFDAVGSRLQEKWRTSPKNVAWTLPFKGDFHIDVVPGRAQDRTFYDATLYRRDRDSTLQTSLKTHIDTVRGSGREDVIRLLKYWAVRQRLPFKTFVLELMTVAGCKGVLTSDLEQQMLRALAYIRDNIETVRLVDPANSNNVISDDLRLVDKHAIAAAARRAIDAKTWGEIFA